MSAECPEGLHVHWGSGQKTCARVCFLVAARQPGHFLETWRCCRQQAWQRRKSQEGHLKKTTSSALQPAHATPAHSNCACPRGKLRGEPGAPVSSAVLCIRKDEILLWVFLGPGLGASRTGSEGMAGPPSWGPGAWVPGPLRSTHICRKRCLWCGRTNMPNLCSRGRSSGFSVVSAATTATTFSKSSSCLYVVSAVRSWL